MSKDQMQNPIDKDKVTETPGTLEYPHHAGSALVKPEDKGKIKGRAVAAMYEQTDAHLNQIREQIELLGKQVQRIEKRKQVSELIYDSKIPFTPLIGHTYHFYQKDDGSYQLSMLSPTEWGKSMPSWEYVNSVRLLADHTWEIQDEG